MATFLQRVKLPLPALRLALFYILAAGLWILFSDRILAWLVTDPLELTRWQSYKGLLFVLAMAVLLFLERARAERVNAERIELSRQHRSAEQKVHVLASRLQAIVQSSPLAILSLDPEGRVTSWNPAAERIFGWSEEEALGQRLPYVPEESVPEFLSLVRRILEGEAINALELRRKRKDGTPMDILIHAAPLYNGGNQPEGIMAVVADITQRKQAEEELRSTREFLLQLMNNAPLPIFATDLEHRCLLVNHAWEALLDVNRRKVIGEKITEFLPPSSGDLFVRNNQQVIDTRQPLVVEESLETSSGTRYFQSIKFPLHDSSGAVEAVGGIAIDITERKQAVESLHRLNLELEQRVAERTAQLAAINAELETFTYSVSHDLKAPLRGIDGYSRLLLEDHSHVLDEEGRGFLMTIRRSVAQMSQLIDDLLAYSRLERRTLVIDTVDPAKLVNAILAQFSAEIQARGVEVDTRLPFDFVYHDKESLFQALYNLIDNAIKFSVANPHPKIKIGGRETETAHILFVQDNGAGFDMKYHDRIFEIFQRLHRIEDFPGTGIGLAIVRKAMQRVGGRVWAESTPGQGSIFYLEIPKPPA